MSHSFLMLPLLNRFLPSMASSLLKVKAPSSSMRSTKKKISDWTLREKRVKKAKKATKMRKKKSSSPSLAFTSTCMEGEFSPIATHILDSTLAARLELQDLNVSERMLTCALAVTSPVKQDLLVRATLLDLSTCPIVLSTRTSTSIPPVLLLPEGVREARIFSPTPNTKASTIWTSTGTVLTATFSKVKRTLVFPMLKESTVQ